VIWEAPENKRGEAIRAYQKKDPTSTAEAGSRLGVRYGAQDELEPVYNVYIKFLTRQAVSY